MRLAPIRTGPLVGLCCVGVLTAAAEISLTIAAPGLPLDQLQLSWEAVPGRGYAIRTRTNLTESWTLLPSDLIPWIAATTRVQRTAAIDSRSRFYQVEESRSPYDPVWAEVLPARTNRFTYDAGRSPTQNGADLKTVLQALLPGDRLEIGAGTYSLDSYTTLDLQGTETAPIWIVAAPGAAVVITRPDAAQNIINVGASQPAAYLCFRGLGFAGGSHGIRLFDCRQVWIDQCRVHDTGDVGLSANARDTSHLYLTRNEIWNTGGTGEGMYLGGHNASVIMSESVIALNHVHDTNQGVEQGDGIEVKQGSWGNLIVGNLVYNCRYPCILVYGTGGQPPNVVERNICFGSGDNTMQIQGECIVRNNLVLAGNGSAFASQPHSAAPTGLTVVHNTFVNAGNAVRLSAWAGGTDMVFANNACYSQNAAALTVVNGFTGVSFAGNVCFGSVTGGLGGYQPGAGLSDFLDLAWDASRRNAHPSPGSTLRHAADPAFATPRDLDHLPRESPPNAGCYGP